MLVAAPFTATRPDEVNLNKHDTVVILDHFYDGWSYGRNLRTMAEGVFPLGYIQPISPTTTFTLVNCVRSMQDIFAQDMLEGALIALPNSLDIHHAVAEGPWDGDVVGVVHAQRIDSMLLSEIFDMGFDGTVFVCGSDSFNGFCFDSLLEIGVDGVKVLPSDRYVDFV